MAQLDINQAYNQLDVPSITHQIHWIPKPINWTSHLCIWDVQLIGCPIQSIGPPINWKSNQLDIHSIGHSTYKAIQTMPSIQFVIQSMDIRSIGYPVNWISVHLNIQQNG